MKKNFLLTAILAVTVAVAVPTAMTKSADAATTDVSSAVVTSMTATAAQSGKWIHGGGWWYQYADGTYPKDCFAKINGKTYYFDHSGYMVTGWKEIDYNTYYFDRNGAMVTGWQSIDGKRYHFDEDGCMATYITYVNDKQQVFAPSGQWVSGWTFDRKIYYNDDGTVDWDNHSWYYANSDGTPYDYNANDDIGGGWLQYGGKWYYIDSDGRMLTDQTVNVYGKNYRLKDDGSMLTGWYQSGNDWYYSNADGTVYNGWRLSGKNWYYFDEDGRMVTYVTEVNNKQQVFAPSGQWVSGWTFDRKIYYNADGTVDWDNYNWYYANSDGTPYDYNKNDDINGGWLQYGGKWYYIDSDGKMLTDCIVTVYGKDYRLKPDGTMVTGWYQSGSEWYYSNADGTLYDGWLLYGKNWYYINGYGCMATSTSVGSNGKDYYVGKDGKLVTGWYYYKYKSNGYSDEYWMYMDSDGSQYTGWVSSGDNWYYIENGKMQCEQWITSKGKDYYLGKDGRPVSGWYHNSYQSDSSNFSYEYWMYMNSDGSKYTGWVSSGGKWYYINNSTMVCDSGDDCVNIEHYRKSDGEIDYDKYNEARNKSRGYVFDKTGAMVTGWYRTTGTSEGGKVYGSSWYYMDSDGQGHQGWLKYNGSWYYFEKGRMQTNCIAPDGSYLGADGISRKIR